MGSIRQHIETSSVTPSDRGTEFILAVLPHAQTWLERALGPDAEMLPGDHDWFKTGEEVFEACAFPLRVRGASSSPVWLWVRTVTPGAGHLIDLSKLSATDIQVVLVRPGAEVVWHLHNMYHEINHDQAATRLDRRALIDRWLLRRPRPAPGWFSEKLRSLDLERTITELEQMGLDTSSLRQPVLAQVKSIEQPGSASRRRRA